MIDQLAVLDFESTSPDPEEARIVSAYLGVITRAGQVTWETEWLIDPGVPIPAQASAIHGIDDLMVQRLGLSPDVALRNIRQHLQTANQSRPLVVFNAAYDLTLLDRELRRHGYNGLGFTPGPVLDPLVLDKAVDRYRKGSRRLTDMAAHYGVELVDAHTARADAIAAGMIAFQLVDGITLDREADGLVTPTAEDLHRESVTWRAQQQESLAAYFHRQGKDTTDVRPEWPLIPHTNRTDT